MIGGHGRVRKSDTNYCPIGSSVFPMTRVKSVGLASSTTRFVNRDRQHIVTYNIFATLLYTSPASDSDAATDELSTAGHTISSIVIRTFRHRSRNTCRKPAEKQLAGELHMLKPIAVLHHVLLAAIHRLLSVLATVYTSAKVPIHV